MESHHNLGLISDVLGIGYAHPYPGLTSHTCWLGLTHSPVPGSWSWEESCGEGETEERRGQSPASHDERPGVSWVSRSHSQRTDSISLSPALTWTIWKSMSDLRFDWSSCDLCQDAVDKNFVSINHFPKQLNNGQANKEWQFHINVITHSLLYLTWN